MENATLRLKLWSMIDQYGIDQVAQVLQEVRGSCSRPKEAKANRPPRKQEAGTRKKPQEKAAVSEYVAKMEVPAGNRVAITELAKRFQDGAFLPTFADISDFCALHGIEEPKSKSRASAVPRVFKFLAAMGAKDVMRIVDHKLYSGPTRLGPIAEAIRRNGRAARMKPK